MGLYRDNGQENGSSNIIIRLGENAATDMTLTRQESGGKACIHIEIHEADRTTLMAVPRRYCYNALYVQDVTLKVVKNKIALKHFQVVHCTQAVS